MTIIKLLAMFLSIAVSGEIYISEIYANPPGSSSSKTWIEIANSYDRQVKISHFSLEIYADNSSKAIVSTDQSFKFPLVLDDFILVAEAADLGLGLCLDRSIPVIIVPELNLRAARKFCFSINNQAMNCLVLSKKDRFSDGVALFRTLIAGQPSNFWLNEPCWLTDAVFATPASSERACLDEPSFADDVFAECEAKEASVFSHGNFTDIWKESICVAHHENAKLCYELSKSFKVPSHWGRLIRFKRRDLSGYLEEESMYLNTERLKIPVSVSYITKTRLRLNFDNHEAVNYRVKNREEVLAAGAFIEPGAQFIEFDLDEDLTSLGLEFYNQDLFERQDLSLRPQSAKYQSCQSSELSLMPWLLFYVLGLLRARSVLMR